MSRKQDRGVNQSKVFISFGDVAGGFKQHHTDSIPDRPSVPLYTGNDSEISVLSKKLLKKDGTTKLRAMQELSTILKTKSESTIAEFLSYYVYCFPRLSIEDQRSIREQLGNSIISIVSVEKRLLAPHMKALIGPWWMLTGDPALEVAERAISAYNNAIPPKKRQPVLAYLGPSIIAEAAKNIRLRPETLSDMSVTTADEANERLERVLISSIASMSKLISMLTIEQLHQLSTLSTDSDSDNASQWSDFINDRLWKKCLTSDFPSVRKATYQFIHILVTHAPDLLLASQSGGVSTVSDVFASQFLESVESETHFPNLSTLLDTFMAVLRNENSFCSAVSISADIIPLLERLLTAHPQLAVDYLLPLIGSLPSAHSALLERSLCAHTPDLSTVDESLYGLCRLLIGLTELAERKSDEGSTGNKEMIAATAMSVTANITGTRSQRNIRTIMERKLENARGVQAECVAAGIKADVCVVELGTLLLLRRSHTALSEQQHTSSSGTVCLDGQKGLNEQVRNVSVQMVQSIVLTVQAAATYGIGHTGNRSCLLHALKDTESVVPSNSLVETVSTSMHCIAKSLQQLQRATLKEMHLTAVQWEDLFWKPLAEAMLDLLIVVVSGENTTDTEQFLTSMIHLVSASFMVVELAWSERPCAGSSIQKHVGVDRVLQTLRDYAVQYLQDCSSDQKKKIEEEEESTLQDILRLAAVSHLCIVFCPKEMLLDLSVDIRTTAVEVLSDHWLQYVLLALSSTNKSMCTIDIPIRLVEALAGSVADIATFIDFVHNSALSRLVQQCITAKSVEGICLVCAYAKNITWDAHMMEWVKTMGTNMVLKSPSCNAVSFKMQLQFLLQMSSCIALEDVVQEWLVDAKEVWCEASYKVASCYILSLIASFYQGNESKVRLPETLRQAVKTLVEIESSQVLTVLSRMFFTRVRSRENMWRSKERSTSALQQGGFDALHHLRVLCEWNDIQTMLIPNLPVTLKNSLNQLILTELNSALQKTSYDSNIPQVVAENEEEYDETDTSTPTFSNLQPKKWSKHLIGLLVLNTASHNHTPDPCADPKDGSSSIASHIALLRMKFWLEFLCKKEHILAVNMQVEAVADEQSVAHVYALECFYHLLTSPEYNTHLHNYIPDGLLFQVLCNARYYQEHLFKQSCATPAPALISALQDTIHQIIAKLPSEAKSLFYSQALSCCLHRVDTSLGHTASLLESAGRTIQALLEHEFPLSLNKDIVPIRLQSPSLSHDSRILTGSTGMYLHWKTVPPLYTTAAEKPPDGNGMSGSAASEALMRVTAIPCKVAAMHREAGSDPYFTIAMDLTGDTAVAHELQVEWPKLAIGRTLAATGKSDLVALFNCPRAQEEAQLAEHSEETTSPNCCPTNFISGGLLSWLEDELSLLLTDLLAHTSQLSPPDSLLHANFERRLDVFLTVLVAVDRAAQAEGNEFIDALEARVLARLRGISLFLLVVHVSIPTAPAWIIGLTVLRTLLQLSTGPGNGYWLPRILNNIRSTLPGLLDTLDADILERGRLLSAVAGVLARLSACTSGWDLCTDVAERVLVPGLQALPSPCATLVPQLLHLLQAVWEHHSETRGLKPEVPMLSDVAEWETEAFDLALFAMVEGISGQGIAARIEACRALHHCLLRRSRKSCRDLLFPSLTEKFADRLEAMVVCEDLVNTSLLGVARLDNATVVEIATVRVTCSKVLDAWVACQSDTTVSQTKRASTTLMEDSLVEDISVQEQENRELLEDAVLLQDVVGVLFAEEVRKRFLVSEKDVCLEDTSSSTVELGQEEDDSSPSTPAFSDRSIPVGGSSNEATSTAGVDARSIQSRRVSKRAALSVMLRRDPLGSVLLWLLILQRVDVSSVQGWSVRSRCVNYLKKTGIVTNAMFLILRLSGDLLQFKDVSALLQRVEQLNSVSTQTTDSSNNSTRQRNKATSDQGQGQYQNNTTGTIKYGSLQHLAIYALFRTVCTLPAMFRSFWNDDCNRVQKTRLSAFVEEKVRVSLIKREIAMITLASNAGRWDTSEFIVKGSAVSGEVTAILHKDETTIEIRVKLPPSYPLKNVEVNCTSRIGVSDGRWRRWVLQIIQLMSMQDGSVVDAVLMWKSNIEKELEGVEPCPICYCTLHSKTQCLPSMACPTCNNKFHSPCLTTWFRSSGKSKCVICQQPFYAK